GQEGARGLVHESVPRPVLRRQPGRRVPDRALLPALALPPAAGAGAAAAVPADDARRLRVREEPALRLPQPRRQRAHDLRQALLAALGERAAARPDRVPAGADRGAAEAREGARGSRGEPALAGGPGRGEPRLQPLLLPLHGDAAAGRQHRGRRLRAQRGGRRRPLEADPRDGEGHAVLRPARAGLRSLDEAPVLRDPHRRPVAMSPRQLELAFDEAPRWDRCALESALAREAGRPLSVVVTDNRSVLLSVRRIARGPLVRLHRMFLHAPAAVVAALARNIRRHGPAADGEVRRFMNENLHRVRRTPRELPPLVTRGRAHDLGEVFADVNERCFGGRVRVPITWGRGVGRARRSGLPVGSYDPVLALIRIPPVLDRPTVPRFFLESVVHHEMLHHQLGGVSDRAGRTVYHTRAFREAEARFPHHRAALAWEKEHLPELLRASQALDRERRAARAAARAALR